MWAILRNKTLGCLYKISKNNDNQNIKKQKANKIPIPNISSK